VGTLYQSVNQSINLFVQKCNKHWTGHQRRMQPPLTGARKDNVSKSNNDNIVLNVEVTRLLWSTALESKTLLLFQDRRMIPSPVHS